MSPREAILIVAILLLSIAVRLPGLLEDGLWRDQANIYVQLTAPTFAEFIHRVTITDWHPPLFFLLMYGWSRIAGTGEFALISLPFVCSIATVAAVYGLGRTTGSIRIAAVAATLYAVAPLSVAYASEYLYPLMGLVSTVLAILVVRARSEAVNAWRWLGLATASLLVVFTHYLGSIYVALLVAWILIDRGTLRRRCAIISALVAGGVPFVFWLPVFLAQRRIGVPYSLVMNATQKLTFFLDAVAQFVPVRSLPLSSIFVAIVLVALISLTRARALERDPLIYGLLFATMLAVIAGLNLASARYALPYFGLACVALASILTRFAERISAAERAPQRRWGLVAAMTLAVVCIAADGANAWTTSHTPKSGIRSIAFTSVNDATHLYILAPDYLASTFAFYARRTHPEFRGFVRWNQPEVFILKQYVNDWNRGDAVARTLADIVGASRGKTQLDVVVDDATHDSGKIPYQRIYRLLNALAARYQPIGRIRHPGRYEAVSEYRFAL